MGVEFLRDTTPVPGPWLGRLVYVPNRRRDRTGTSSYFKTDMPRDHLEEDANGQRRNAVVSWSCLIQILFGHGERHMFFCQAAL